MKFLATAIALFLITLAVACGGDDEDAGTNSPTATQAVSASPAVSGPVGIIAIGHSGLNGQASDPDNLDRAVRENSWATGTNTEVTSIYQRLIAVRPETEGHVVNAAVSGSEAFKLVSQAQSALNQVPQPELVIIQTLDNDIRCDGTDEEHVPAYGTAIANVLQVITEASPESKILIVSEIGSPETYSAAIADNADARSVNAGTGICDMFSPDGELVEEHVATLSGIIEMYEEEQERVCATVAQCHTDDRAFTTYVDDIDHLAGDWGHFNVQGLNALAGVMWPTVAALLGVPVE